MTRPRKCYLEEGVHVCDPVRNSMDSTDSKKSPFEIFHGDKLKIIGSLSEIGRMAYFTKRGKFRSK